MIRDKDFFEKWERRQMKKESPNYLRNLSIFEALVAEAKLLGVWPPTDPLEGIEVDLKIAQVINVLKPSGKG